MTTKSNLVTNLMRETANFDDEICSRHHFGVRNGQFWRRDSFSSPFWAGKRPILTTRFALVTILGWETLIFGDEPSFSSPFLVGKLHFLATRPVLVAILGWVMVNFDDETRSRRHFDVENIQFWRRDSFSSPIWGKERLILTTRLILVTNFRWETVNFDDETQSRHHFGVSNGQFWRRNPFSPIFLGAEQSYLSTSPFSPVILMLKGLSKK